MQGRKRFSFMTAEFSQNLCQLRNSWHRWVLQIHSISYLPPFIPWLIEYLFGTNSVAGTLIWLSTHSSKSRFISDPCQRNSRWCWHLKFLSHDTAVCRQHWLGKWKETELLPWRSYQFIQWKIWYSKINSSSSRFCSHDLDIKILAFIHTLWMYIYFLICKTVSGSVDYENLSKKLIDKWIVQLEWSDERWEEFSEKNGRIIYVRHFSHFFYMDQIV